MTPRYDSFPPCGPCVVTPRYDSFLIRSMCSDPLDMTGTVCNGVGQCECGKCVCDRISEESELVFQGPYCQYNPLNCPIARDDSGQFKPCAGEEKYQVCILYSYIEPTLCCTTHSDFSSWSFCSAAYNQKLLEFHEQHALCQRHLLL